MSESPSENRHAPTQTGLQRAHQEGNFARSSQLGSLLFCCGALAVVILLGTGIANQISASTNASLGRAPTTSGVDLLGNSSKQLWNVVTTITPLLCLFCAIAWLAHSWQSRFQFFPSRLKIDFGKMNPASNLARLCSKRTLWNALIGLLRMLCVLGFSLALIWSMRERIGIVGMLPRSESLDSIVQITLMILGGGMAIMFLFGLIDWLWQVKSHEASLRLNDQQLRDELKSTEGDPLIRSRQRAIQRSMSEGGLEPMQAIEERT